MHIVVIKQGAGSSRATFWGGDKVKAAETNQGKTTTRPRFATPRCFLLSDTWGRTQKEARVTTNRSLSLT